MPRQVAHFYSTVAGIPCGIYIETYLSVPPWRGPASSCPSADDYYGYTEIEYTILDRKGYPAKWLEKKLTPSDDERIKEEIVYHMTTKAEPDYDEYLASARPSYFL